MAENWFALVTKMRREKDATEEVQALGFECYLPIEVRIRQDRSKKARPLVEYAVPMIPGYIFPRFDLSQPCGWQKLGRLQTVKGWLKPTLMDNPSPIRSDFIDRVRMEQIAICAALRNDQSIVFEPLAKGTRVIITEGPFATMGGIVDMSVGKRVKLLFDAAGFSDLHIARQSLRVA